MIKITLTGKEKLTGTAVKIRNVKKEIPTTIKSICDKFGNRVIRLAKQKYMLEGRDAPVNPFKLTSRHGVTGLRGGIFFQTKMNGNKALIDVGVKASIPYAKKHEFGIGIKKRPFLTPAINEGLPAFKNDLTHILDRLKTNG